MTITVPTLALVIPLMLAYFAGYLIVAHKVMTDLVEAAFAADGGVTPRAFTKLMAVAVLAGVFWPVWLVIVAVREFRG